MMNKLGILGIVIAIAFVTGILTVNPGAEGVSGWQGALIEVNEDIEGILLFLEENSDFFDFDLQQMSDDITKNAEDIVDNADRITDLENEVVSIENQVENCMEDDVPKRDSDSLTGWSCQDDDAGDGGDSKSIRLIPQKVEPEPCGEGTLGTMYFRDDPTVAEPSSLCVCKDIVGDGSDVIYMDATGNDKCTSP